MRKHVLVLTTSAFVVCGAVTANAQQGPEGPIMQRPDQQQNQEQGPGILGLGGIMGRGMMSTGTTGQGETMDRGTTGQGGMMGPGMMGQGGMMGHGMMGQRGPMGRGMMGQAGMMGPIMMRMIFALMDSDGDGYVTLQEFQAAHERIFKAMDADKDGRLTFEEIQAFMQGTRRSAPPQ